MEIQYTIFLDKSRQLQMRLHKNGGIIMVQEWLAKGVFLYLMAGICGAGIVFKLLLTGYYNRQLYYSRNMGGARKKWLLKMRQDYAACMDMHGKVNNVDIFVDKYVEGKKFMGIMLSTWDKIGGQAWILCAGLLVMAAVSGVFYEVDREAILFTFFIGIWTVIVDIVVDNISNLAEKRKLLKRNLADYFENHAWDGLEGLAKEEEQAQEDFSQGEAFWEERAFSPEEAEGDFEANTAFARESSIGQEEGAQEETASEADAYGSAIRIRHLLKPEHAAQQGLELEEWKRKMERKENAEPSADAPKFYVVSKAEKGRGLQEAEDAGKEAAAKRTEEELASAPKVHKESKKEMAARKKREHMKYELKREMTQKDAGKEENFAQEEGVPPERRTASKEAVEQLAAALDLLKKENALEEAAPLLAAQIGRDQENGALIEEVLREFLV